MPTPSDALSQRQRQYQKQREAVRHLMPEGMDNETPGEDEADVIRRRLAGLPSNWKDDFLIFLAECGFVREACRLAGISVTQAYRTKRLDPEFAKAWADIVLDQVEQLEDEAQRRAINGSDVLLMFLLRAKKPEVYNDKGKKEEITINITSDKMALAQEQIEQWKQQRLGAGPVANPNEEVTITLDPSQVEVISNG